MILVTTVRQLFKVVLVVFVVGIIATGMLAAHLAHASSSHEQGKVNTIATTVCPASGSDHRAASG
jgi:hypothetical protein